MQTTMIGRRAEVVAAQYLAARGYVVLERNWRRRQCEIDLVARKDGMVRLVEVKYRSSDGAGRGLEYIGPHKLRQMAYAAQRWVAENHWTGPYDLMAIEVSGKEFVVSACIDGLY